MKKIIAIDFDNTLVYTKDGVVHPMPGAAEAVRNLADSGAKIIIHTCRTTLAGEAGELEEELAFIHETLVEFGIPYDEIFAGPKLVADYYIDDRAIPFHGDWEEVEEDVLERQRLPKAS